ncbi:MAG: hypothetical protein ABIA04_02910 [Pseudomonadota bacterium]
MINNYSIHKLRLIIIFIISIINITYGAGNDGKTKHDLEASQLKQVHDIVISLTGPNAKPNVLEISIGVYHLSELAQKSTFESVYTQAAEVLANLCNKRPRETFKGIQLLRSGLSSGPALKRAAEVNIIILSRSNSPYLTSLALEDLIQILVWSYGSPEAVEIKAMMGKLYLENQAIFDRQLGRLFPDLKDNNRKSKIVHFMAALKDAATKTQDASLCISIIDFLNRITQNQSYSEQKRTMALEAETAIIHDLVETERLASLLETSSAKLTTRHRIYDRMSFIFPLLSESAQEQTLLWLIERATNPRNKNEMWDQKYAIDALGEIASKNIQRTDIMRIVNVIGNLMKDPLLEQQAKRVYDKIDAAETAIWEGLERAAARAETRYVDADLPKRHDADFDFDEFEGFEEIDDFLLDKALSLGDEDLDDRTRNAQRLDGEDIRPGDIDSRTSGVDTAKDRAGERAGKDIKRVKPR